MINQLTIHLGNKKYSYKSNQKILYLFRQCRQIRAQTSPTVRYHGGDLGEISSPSCDDLSRT